MGEVLIPLSDLGVAEVAEQIRANVLQARENLIRRYSLGTVARFGSLASDGDSRAYRAADRAIRADQATRRGEWNVWHFAIQATGTSEGVNLGGVASISKGLALGVARLPLKASLAKRIPWGYERLGGTNEAANVTGWITATNRLLLSRAYSEMVSFANEHDILHTWTIEPADVPDWIERAIRGAGLTPISGGPRQYDVGESEFPPYSHLYNNEVARVT